ncbi:phosphoribosylanthranilate isomerase [Lachnospira multipara]|uniref:phosphoribosylanthranilate isomerase n=1 Tax=Lachnospira multipara TaxID=28051 RepID=UPI000687B325|nr:phosphoribosylanthranilate isomerase [Lachnospira multipara]
MNRPEIKICGLTLDADVDAVIENKVDYAGFVLFFKESKRYIDIDLATSLMKKLQKNQIKTVAVTVSPTINQVELINRAGFDYIQIHGSLTKEVIEKIHIPIILAINVKDTEVADLQKASKEYQTKIYAYLFDGVKSGSGQSFNWDLIDDFDIGNKKLFLSGGLNEDNVESAIRKVNPDVVDVSSGVEYEDKRKGKDKKKIDRFCKCVRKVNGD